MIMLNGVKFAKNNKEFVNSLFEKDGTCSGFYKVNKCSISLYDQKRNKIGVICNMVVGKASKIDNGKYWYSYSKPEMLGVYDSKQEDIDLKKIYKQYPMPIIY